MSGTFDADISFEIEYFCNVCFHVLLVNSCSYLFFFADIRTKILQPYNIDRGTVALQCAILGVLSLPVS